MDGADPKREAAAAQPPKKAALWTLTAYFLKLGAVGFGGPPALIGYMYRDLVEREGSLDADTYRLALALAQIMPGPLAAQTAIAIGYFQAGILGATVVGLAFVLPSFLMVIVLSLAYVTYGGLWWMQALFYGIGAAVIAIIAIGTYRLARGTNKQDPLLWGMFAVLFIATVWAQAELAELFLLAGLAMVLARAWPGWQRAISLSASIGLLGGIIWLTSNVLLQGASADQSGDLLLQIFIFFTKAGAFVFGSGLAIVPFLNQGVVQQFGWLTEHQFLDAVAVAMVTPGPVVITVAFIGYLVAGLPGALIAALAIFLPVYVLTIIPAPWFQRHRDNAQLKAFAAGATAAATGAIAGAVVVLGQRALFDVSTVLIALVSLGLLWRFKLTEPVLVMGAGAVGLVLWPLSQSAR